MKTEQAFPANPTIMSNSFLAETKFFFNYNLKVNVNQFLTQRMHFICFMVLNVAFLGD